MSPSPKSILFHPLLAFVILLVFTVTADAQSLAGEPPPRPIGYFVQVDGALRVDVPGTDPVEVPIHASGHMSLVYGAPDEAGHVALDITMDQVEGRAGGQAFQEVGLTGKALIDTRGNLLEADPWPSLSAVGVDVPYILTMIHVLSGLDTVEKKTWQAAARLPLSATMAPEQVDAATTFQLVPADGWGGHEIVRLESGMDRNGSVPETSAIHFYDTTDGRLIAGVTAVRSASETAYPVVEGATTTDASPDTQPLVVKDDLWARIVIRQDDFAPVPVAGAGGYLDPALRYRLALPEGWDLQPDSVSHRLTAFWGPNPQDIIYVQVTPGDRAGTSLQLAENSLETYKSNQQNFTLISDPTPVNVGLHKGYMAEYGYTTATGSRLKEGSLFVSVDGVDYTIQYTDTPGSYDRHRSVLDGLARRFRVGIPRGYIEPSSVRAGGFTTYTDPQERFRMRIPKLWPLYDQNQEEDSVTFLEPGGNGTVRIDVGSEVAGYTPLELLQGWQAQWDQDPDIVVLSPAVSVPGQDPAAAELTYWWKQDDERSWIRRMRITLPQGRLITVDVDYRAPGFFARADVIGEMLDSFRLLEVPKTQPPAPDESPSENVPAVDSATGEPAHNGAVEELPVEQTPIDPPTDAQAAIAIGRILTASQQEGATAAEPAAGVDITLDLGDKQYSGQTDEKGFFFLPNIGPLQNQPLRITRLTGPMFHFADPVSITFENVEVKPAQSRVADFGTLTITLKEGSRLEVAEDTGGRSVDPNTPRGQFLARYPTSLWAKFLQDEGDTPLAP